ncbi:MAG: carboxylesterase/lipase family protein [Woeseiaceae bacterium]
MIDTQINTTLGRVRGYLADGARVWQGVPYATPPLGELRWQPPQPHSPWKGLREAHRYGPPAVQHLSPMGAQIAGGFGVGDEDCLTLNIFSPEHATTKRPVMVWIHGGGFSVGASSQAWYDGTRLARENNTVIVSINYRLGALGFLRLTDVTGGQIPATGNEGLMDQIAALQWIRDNIAQFGGDRENITLFGESAGGMAIASLLTIPAAAGLFDKAVIQSGSAHGVHSLETANRVADQFLKLLPEDARNNPYEADPTSLAEATATINGRMMLDERLSIMPMRPVVDGAFQPDVPAVAMRNGNASKIPVVIGYNKDEWRYFAQVDRAMKRLDHAALHERLTYHFTDAEIDRLLTAYDYRKGQAGETFRVYSAFHGDAAFCISSERAVNALAAHQPVYKYRFDVPAPGLGGLMGACHVTEIPYVFGTLDAIGMNVLFQTGDLAESVSKDVRQWWTQFAATGQPDRARWSSYADHPGKWAIHEQSAYLPAKETLRDHFWSSISDDKLTTI